MAGQIKAYASDTSGPDEATDVTETELGATGQTIGRKHAADVATSETPLYEIVDESDPSQTFVGHALTNGSSTALPDEAAAIWRIRRIAPPNGPITRKQYATDGVDNLAVFNKIWNSRASLFPATPYINNSSAFLDGSNDHLLTPNNAVFDFDYRSEAASGSIWVKTSDTTGSVVYMEKVSGTVGMTFQLASNRLTLELRGTGGTGDRLRRRGPTGAGAIINDGEWHHLAWTYDGSGDVSGIELYIDAAANTPYDDQNNGLVTDTSNAGPLAIGANVSGGMAFGPGFVDEPSIWDVELTSGEITTIYNLGVPIDLQDQGVSPITASLNWFLRNGDGANDDPDNLTLEDVQSNLTATMENMNPGNIVTEVPTG